MTAPRGPGPSSARLWLLAAVGLCLFTALLAWLGAPYSVAATTEELRAKGVAEATVSRMGADLPRRAWVGVLAARHWMGPADGRREYLSKGHLDDVAPEE